MIVHYSTKWKEQIGYEDHEIRDDFDEWQSRVHPDDLDATIKKVRESIDQKRADHKVEFRFRHKDGSYRWILAQASILQDKTGRPIRMIGSHVNITDRKKAERKSLFLQTAIDQAPVGIALADENINIYYCNPEGLGMRGGATKDLVEIPKDAFKHWQVFMLNGEPYEIEDMPLLRAIKKGEIIREEFIVRHQDGTNHICDAFACPVFENGNILGGMVIFLDITERKRTFKEIKKANEIMQLAADAAQFGVWYLDIKENRLEWDDWMFRLYGINRDNFSGDYEAWQATVHPDDLERSSKEVEQALRGEEKFNTEFRIIRPDGEVRHLKAYAIVSRDNQGNPTHITGINYDITERKELEERIQQSQKMESIGNLAGGIAHDFNNILFPIIGMSELLMEDLPQDSPERESAEEIFKAGQRGSDLVKQILAFSRRSEHKKIPTRLQQVLKEVLREVTKNNPPILLAFWPVFFVAAKGEYSNMHLLPRLEYEPKFGAIMGGLFFVTSLKLSRSTIPSFIEINQDIQPDCGLIMADPTQIHQVSMNIITNAYHAVEGESGKITVRLEEMMLKTSGFRDIIFDSGKYAVLSISDTEHGMSDDLITKIFDPYFTTKEKEKGTGLGLALVFGIVKDHRGDITVKSEIGEGTTFTVYLPLMEKSASIQSIDAVEAYKGGNERILLVDDEETVANLEKKMLERLGYQVTMRLKSRETLEEFRLNPNSYDLILSDMTMPNLTGDRLAIEIKSIRPDIPVIICTGFSERIDEEKTKTLGIDGLLTKPVARAELAKMVRKVLDGAKGPAHA